MATIDTNMSLVMIDPNEPLELYDGTIIKGRLEWFLYALCCLDYGNLPTPLSRIEEWANALITNELPNMEPQSRAEEFFKAILTGDTSNLPTPQSRSEVLLDKLARGENDFTNVEKIQSRYEFLLAYLIKNGGGIGNIDYVLYKFQKEDETLYNTKERPVKSAILKGQTLVNLMTNCKDEYVVRYHSIDNPRYTVANISMMKPNTEYTLFYKAKYRTEGDGSGIGGSLRIATSIEQGFITTSQSYTTEYKQYVYKITTSSVVDCFVFASTGKYFAIKECVLLEGDYTQEDIPFFEGMQSVKMPGLTTTGKNLFDLELVQGGHSYGVVGTKPVFNMINSRVTNVTGNYIKVNPNTKITFSISNDIDFAIAELDINGYTLGDTGWVGYTTIKPNHTITTKEKTSYIGFNFRKFDNSNITAQEVLGSDPMLEISDTATTHEPFKSNILTTTRKNLFNMNRPYDNLTDSQAAVVQDTNQITVSSSAESGIYVNANFILDKDFFAGKTVTGSCLYESDEKDIGTVQIVYQDGNGEHHYQWIRTPRTFTFPNSFIGDVMLSVSANNTDTPQSNTVTVKNIQLELGSTATSYEPYSEGVTLRGIGEVKDELNCLTGEVVERIGEIVFDGNANEQWKIDGWWANKIDTIGFEIESPAFLSDKIICETVTVSNYSGLITKDERAIAYSVEYGVVMLRLLRTELATQDLKGLKQWLSQNPIVIQYQLATPTVKTVDLTITDQGGATIPKLNTFDKITHVNVSATDILPEVEMEVATTIGEDLSGTVYSTMEDIETKQEALKESNNAQTESINSTMMATTEIYESLL